MREGSASITAQRVAAHRLTFDRVPTPYGDPAADERLANDVAGSVSVDPAGPMLRYLAARTAFFDRAVVSALDGGVTQVVIAAAGYDGRALRYAKPGVRFVELDHPATQRDKLRRLAHLGLDVSAVTFVAADFAVDDVAAALRDAGLDRTVPSLVLCEGVAVYLDRPVLAALLRGLRGAVAAGSRLVISLSVAQDSPGVDARRAAFRRAVAAVGEPARTVLTADDAAGLFAAAGWQPEPATSPGARYAGFVVADAV